jgi:hypothetical protein
MYHIPTGSLYEQGHRSGMRCRTGDGGAKMFVGGLYVWQNKAVAPWKAAASSCKEKHKMTVPVKPWTRFGHSSEETNPPPEPNPRRRRRIGSLLFKRDLLLIRCDEVTTLFRILAEALVSQPEHRWERSPSYRVVQVSLLWKLRLRSAFFVPPGNEVPKETEIIVHMLSDCTFSWTPGGFVGASRSLFS